MKPILYGLRASGKTSVLDGIKRETGAFGEDTDKLVLQEIGKTHNRIGSIGEFVDGPGNWQQFRDIEHKVVMDSVCDDTIDILALGGGVIAFHRNRHAIDPVDTYNMNPHDSEQAKQGIIQRVFNREKYPKTSTRIFLDVGLEEQERRLRDDDEGNKDRPDLGQELQQVYDDRIDIYRRFADITVSVDGKTIDEIVKEILGHEQIMHALKKAA